MESGRNAAAGEAGLSNRRPESGKGGAGCGMRDAKVDRPLRGRLLQKAGRVLPTARWRAVSMGRFPNRPLLEPFRCAKRRWEAPLRGDVFFRGTKAPPTLESPTGRLLQGRPRFPSTAR